jgi:FdhD protein
MEIYMQPTRQAHQCYQYQDAVSKWETVDSSVITETTVALHVNGKNWLSFACSPSDLDALAAGFLFNEGFIQRKDEIALIEVCKQECNIDVWLNKSIERPESWQRTSGCTGGFTTAGDQNSTVLALGEQTIAPSILLECMEQLLRSQSLYREAGGVHSSAICDAHGVRVVTEDIGRHNTIDKLAGRALLDDIQVDPLILITTGRVSSDMLQKAARLKAAVVVSRTSPTTQSVALAEQFGITLVGYARRDRFLVYSHPARLGAIPTGEQAPQPGENPQDR